MLWVISLIMIFGYSIYFSIISKSKNQNRNNSLSKCIPMVLGMTSSVTIGLIIALFIPEMLAVSTILSIVLSAVVAILIGMSFGLSGMLEAQSASLMGSMMGAMLGVMLSANEMTMMVVAIDFIYLGSIYSMLLLMNKDSNVTKRSVLTSKSPFFYLTMVFSVCVIAGAALLPIDGTKVVEVEATNQHMHEHGQ